MRKKCPTCILMTIAAVVAVVAGFLISKYQADRVNNISGLQNSLVSATAFPPGFRKVPEFTLQDATGKSFTTEDLKDHWSLAFFGYTSCPDVCPATLGVLKAAMADLSQESAAKNTQVVFISVDPERDTIEQLGRYVTYFNASFRAATGSHTELNKLTEPLGVIYLRAENPNSAEDYLVDHSAGILVIDPVGELRGILSAPHEPENIVADYTKIRKHFN